jgi:hypothetical protein
MNYEGSASAMLPRTGVEATIHPAERKKVGEVCLQIA